MGAALFLLISTHLFMGGVAAGAVITSLIERRQKENN